MFNRIILLGLNIMVVVAEVAVVVMPEMTVIVMEKVAVIVMEKGGSGHNSRGLGNVGGHGRNASMSGLNYNITNDDHKLLVHVANLMPHFFVIYKCF